MDSASESQGFWGNEDQKARASVPGNGRAPIGKARAADPEPVSTAIHDAGDIDPAKIPPRGWLLGATFCRKFLSGLIAEGAAGKTSIRYVQYLALASGKQFTGEHIYVRSRVLIVCLEDSLDEVKRRVAAAMLHHGIAPQDVKGWLFYCTPKGLKLLQTNPDGAPAAGQLYSDLRAIIQKFKIDLVGIDPFVKAHGVPENDNNLIDQVCLLLTDIADEFDCAADTASHARKGQAAPGDADRDRGASSKRDAGRLMRTVTGMTAEEAELFGVNSADRRALIRVDDAKVNITPKSVNAMWFKLIGVSLGNISQTYPQGDNVQTVERWHPPDAFDKLNATTIDAILNKIEAGPYEDGRYSPASNAQDRSVLPVVQAACPEFTDKQIWHVIKTWLKTGVLEKRDHEDPRDRHDHPSLFVVKRPGNTWES
jgi:hypothetical protein